LGRLTTVCAVLAGLGFLVWGCGGKEKASTGMSDTIHATASADTGSALRPDTTASAAPADSTHPTPAVKDSTGAPSQAGTKAVRGADTAAKQADTSAKKKAAAPSANTKKPAAPRAAASQPAAQDTGTQTAEAPLRDKYHPAPLDTVPQQVYEGWKQFNLNCARCHGEDVLGTTIAPHLIISLKPDGPINTKELFMSTVCSGRPEKGMPAWCSLGLGMDKIEQIYTYVKGRSDGKIHPGRPAVRQAG
jgi:hypothetical protein